MNEFKNIDFLKQQALMTSKLSRIDIYIGDVSPLNIKGAEKVQEMRPFAPGEWGDQFEFFKNNCYGTFTAFLFPSKVKVKIQNLKAGELPETLNGTENMNYGIPTEEMIQAQVQKILENERLKMRLAQLEDEAEANDMWGQRFGAAVNMIIDRFIPGSSQAMEAEPVLNGTENLNGTEQALVILVEKFGEEWLQKFAAKVSADPKLVPQIKAFFS